MMVSRQNVLQVQFSMIHASIDLGELMDDRIGLRGVNQCTSVVLGVYNHVAIIVLENGQNVNFHLRYVE